MSNIKKRDIKSISLREIKKRLNDGSLTSKESMQINGEFDKVRKLLISTTSSIDNEIKKILLPLANDIYRAANIVSIVSNQEDFTKIIEAINANLQSNGELTSIQIMLTILKSQGLDDAQIAAKLGSTGGRKKKGHKSDIRLALEEVVKITGEPNYQTVRCYLSNDENHSSLNKIQIQTCDLPPKSNLPGVLAYSNSKDEYRTIGANGIVRHLNKIKEEMHK